jgi:succinate dehydrogenase hydrophobic anchor subunit
MLNKNYHNIITARVTAVIAAIHSTYYLITLLLTKEKTY